MLYVEMTKVICDVLSFVIDMHPIKFWVFFYTNRWMESSVLFLPFALSNLWDLLNIYFSPPKDLSLYICLRITEEKG